MSSNGFRQQIEAGAKLLDEKVPGWVERQNLEKLDISDIDNCVVGQTFPDRPYTEALMELFDEDDEQSALHMSLQYGFCIPSDRTYEGYSQLTEEWIEYIEGRLGA